MNNSLNQLKHKKRTINDLVRHLKNRTDDEPNYILFLGAGASVSSGIRSGSKLVDIWKKEIYESEDIDGKQPLDDWLKNQLSWYDDNNEYSSLFEKRFDLPAQRRNFIEGEVSNKIPFIGYAYLVKLVNKNFINTIMTTNFDDLLSEAFYVYGNHNGSENYSSLNRPIVCAHDSTINSININSKRPKIIKLHGDYLYDNIKSSLRETESLETNIKNKLIELSKNKGLIVIGYAGSDRSIMDTLNFLLSNEDYLKHGVYWCIRKGDEPSKNLEKLLWKDRVYFVEIDGYDELMAELNYHINEGQLPIETNVTLENYNYLTEKLSNDSISNKYIKKDIEKLSLQKESRIFTDFFETLNIQSVDSRDRSKKNINRLKIDEEVFLLQERKKLKNNKKIIVDEIIENCNKKIKEEEIISKAFKVEILELISRCYELKGEYKEALKKIREIEDIDKYNPKYFQKKIKLIDSYEEKIKECDKSIDIDKYNYIPYVQKALIKMNYFKHIGKKIPENEKNEIEENLKKSIELEPGKHNMSHYIYVTFILDHKESNHIFPSKTQIPNQNKNQKSTCINEAREILKEVAKQDPFDSEIVKSSIEIKDKENKTKDKIQEYLQKKLEEAPYFKKEDLYTLLFNFYFEKNMKDDIKKLIKKVEEEEIYKSEIDVFIKNKANIEFKYNKNIEGAINIYKKNVNFLNNDLLEELAKLYLYNNNLEEAKELIFNKIESSIILKKSYFIKVSDFDLALEELEKWALRNKTREIDYIRYKSLILLHAEKYQEAFNFFGEKNIKKIEDVKSIKDILYNFEFTKKKLGDKISLEKPSNSNEEKVYMIAYYFLNDEHKKAIELIKSEMNLDYSKKYMFSEWCYFKNLTEYEFLYK